MKHKHIVDRICLALGVSLAQLARDLGITRSAINDWKSKNVPIPTKHCAFLENRLKNTSDQLTRVDMRPNDWHEIWPELATQEQTESETAA
ncbi:MAG: helix-turn-helix domain-containing protein [Proteobacteria bacterium]|nr:helix-turn-helix domain-containing protein [Pseudomonadota bacterium]